MGQGEQGQNDTSHSVQREKATENKFATIKLPGVAPCKSTTDIVHIIIYIRTYVLMYVHK